MTRFITLVLAFLALTTGAYAQCAGGLIINCPPAAAPQPGDAMLLWQPGQTPHMRKVTVNQLATGGTVTSVGVATANGFIGTVANPSGTPVITLGTTVTGLLVGNGAGVSAAVNGIDYLGPAGSGAGLIGITWGQIGATPTTLAGYGITNALTPTGNGSGLTGLSYTQLPSLVQNQVLGSLITAAPSGLTVPSCSGTNNALIWVSGGGFGCSTIATTGSGTVTSASVATANGFAGTVATATTTPAITITITPTGILKGVSGGLVAATAGTDYLAPAGSGAGLTGLTYGQFPALSANAVLGALTATTPSGLAVPSCSGATNALIWTSGTGFGCNTISGSGGGTITGVTAGTGLTGGGTSGTVTISDGTSGVTAGSYTNANITVNAQGKVTAAANGSGGSGAIMNGHIFGCTVSNSTTTPNTIINVAACQATDSTNAVLMSQSASTVTFTSAGAGGLDTGSAAASTWYAILIINGSSGTAYMATKETAGATISPTMPTGYTSYRYIGSVKFNASTALLAFTQTGQQFRWGTSTVDLNTTTPATVETAVTLSVPPGLVTFPILLLEINPATAGDFSFVYGGTSSPFDAALQGAITTHFSASQIRTTTNTSSQISYNATSASDTVQINTIGWIDPHVAPNF